MSDAQFELLRWYFIEVDDDTGFDAAADVIARAVRQGRAGHAGRPAVPVAAIEARDLLADLAEVAGHRADPAGRPARPAARAGPGSPRVPGADRHGSCATCWRTQGVRVTNAGNVPRLDPADLRQALARRLDDTGR